MADIAYSLVDTVKLPNGATRVTFEGSRGKFKAQESVCVEPRGGVMPDAGMALLDSVQGQKTPREKIALAIQSLESAK